MLPAESHWWHDSVAEHFPTKATPPFQALGLGQEVLSWNTSRLSSGERQRLSLARLLVQAPQALLLDEPTAGLNDEETNEFRDLLFKIRNMGITVLVIEHHMKFIMEVCDDLVVLNFGAKIAEGPPREIQRSPTVIEAYLGTEEEID